MNIPGLDLCASGEDDSEAAFELVSFKGKIRIPKSQMYGACRPVTDFTKIRCLKITSDWIIRECYDPRKKETVCVMKYKDSSEAVDDIDNNLTVNIREIEILNKVKHDNIIQFYETAVGDTLQSVHLVFEFSPYFLSDLINKNVTWLYQKPMIKSIILQLLRGIEYLHGRLIIHRDLSPRNILFIKNGFLKIANFHYARKLTSIKKPKSVEMDKNHQAPKKKTKHAGSATSKCRQAPKIKAGHSGSAADQCNQAPKIEAKHGSSNHKCFHASEILLKAKNLGSEICYQAPELVLKAEYHGSAVDIWAIGCIFAELLIKKKIFNANLNEASTDQEESSIKKGVVDARGKLLENIINVLGLPSNSIWKEYESLPGLQDYVITSGHKYSLLKNLLVKSDLSTDNSIKMIVRLLVYDPALRLTAIQALKHPYFIHEAPVAYSEEKVADFLNL